MNPLPTDPDAMLADLLDSLMTDRPVHATTREWLITGILRAMRRCESLDVALRLQPLGGGRSSSLQRRLLTLRRDAHLVQAIQGVALDDRVGTWERCRRLSAEIERFTRVDWPATRGLPTPPCAWPAFRAHLWWAFCCDVGIPESARRLRELCAQTGGCLPRKDWEKMLANFL